MSVVYQVFLDDQCKMTTSDEGLALDKAEALLLVYDCLSTHRMYILKSYLETQLEPELLELTFSCVKLEVEEEEEFEMVKGYVPVVEGIKSDETLEWRFKE